MIILLIILFFLGYLLITLEHTIRLNKAATALLTGVLAWTVYRLYSPAHEPVVEELTHHLAQIAEIAFFLLGAMTIVELIDAHNGFQIITDRIRTRRIRTLFWVIGGITFVLSALLDNLTTAIVMASLLPKLIPFQKLRQLFAGIIILSANAGGAWSPLGDVTTTMLWIGGQISTSAVVLTLILPSLVALIVPLLILHFRFSGPVEPVEAFRPESEASVTARERNTMFLTGVGMLVMVPVFKVLTGLPPYLGMLLGLGTVWVMSEALHHRKDEEDRRPLSAAYALSKIDTGSILFFVGILLAIGALEAAGILEQVAHWLDRNVASVELTTLVIGLASAVVDNVPLVAASMSMYSLKTFPQDHRFWHLLAYCAGTGGSLLLIGSAAGVAVMGIERLTFTGYLKQIGPLALAGYAAGALVLFWIVS
ncbi:sodium:proton antiporter NhaD [Larkinella soli]|uniref:sodium:proton antiporter NhaD n=1 Tax=Larkinella soli TaxID=1770527 RepID=UPI000FFC7A6E|nr:sodium:proton antiporter NhaD [Larkinella soli]